MRIVREASRCGRTEVSSALAEARELCRTDSTSVIAFDRATRSPRTTACASLLTTASRMSVGAAAASTWQIGDDRGHALAPSRRGAAAARTALRPPRRRRRRAPKLLARPAYREARRADRGAVYPARPMVSGS